MLIPLFLLVGAWFVAIEQNRGLVQAMLERNGNVTVPIVLCVLAILERVLYVSKKTNIWISVYSTTIQMIATPLILGRLVAYFLLRDKEKKDGGKKKK